MKNILWGLKLILLILLLAISEEFDKIFFNHKNKQHDN
jgi:hypothetical protein